MGENKANKTIEAVQGVLKLLKTYGLEPTEINCTLSRGDYVDVSVTRGFKFRFDTGYGSGSPENPILTEVKTGDLAFSGTGTYGHMEMRKVKK
jgi:hypothetical protein